MREFDESWLARDLGRHRDSINTRCRGLADAREARAKAGGESGIRTHGRVSPTHAFQACSFNHSDISPFRINYLQATIGIRIANCVTPPNVSRALTGVSSIATDSRVQIQDRASRPSKP